MEILRHVVSNQQRTDPYFDSFVENVVTKLEESSRLEVKVLHIIQHFILSLTYNQSGVEWHSKLVRTIFG